MNNQKLYQTSAIIGGSSLTGMTRMSKELAAETGFLRVSTANAVTDIGKHPRFGISHAGDFIETTRNFESLTNNALNVFYKDSGIIWDSYHLTPEECVRLKLNRHYAILFMICPRPNIDQRLYELRNLPPGGRSFDALTDHQLRGAITGQAAHSLEIETSCLKFNIPFLDLSDNYDWNFTMGQQAVLERMKAPRPL